MYNAGASFLPIMFLLVFLTFSPYGDKFVEQGPKWGPCVFLYYTGVHVTIYRLQAFQCIIFLSSFIFRMDL
jgi:hypothetical protein